MSILWGCGAAESNKKIIIMFIFGLIIVFIFIIIILFAFPRFSPIPYYPSNHKDMSHILKALNVRKDQFIVDLGAGDGIVIFKAAQEAYQNNLNTQFYAVEINPVLLLILWIRKLFHANRKNIYIVRADMFTTNYDFLSHFQLDDLMTLYLYISPWFINKTIKNAQKYLKNFEVVSYFYPVRCLSTYKEEIVNGVHKLHIYSKK